MTHQNRPDALIFRAPGTNCDRELAHAFERAGASPRLVHLDALISDPDALDRADLIGFPGGFSYGDDIAAGRVFADRLRRYLHQPLVNAIHRGVPIIGICNGFQVLVKAGLLPDPDADGQSVTLSHNTSGRFVDRWVGIEPVANTRCVWTQDLAQPYDLPIAHGEGRLALSDNTLQYLEANGQVALRYAEDVNGSAGRVAGLCDPTGLVLGLMPHPERCCDPLQHPQWSRLGEAHQSATPPGLTMITNAVRHAGMANV
ncbi:phosphoribosylformylglycinamidine synthase subunit PurQ [Mucisphaera calidilacus]|uniref:Phosphoribosylformylglycinamidine synthase n=1 Tax=Mucisphaera calidilacus TaxID=2527982 RepID=A0A518BV36_9BACT|nr:phosphoribosylformylglycinamidine synthase subunit PurQ [Mucisphaera calidilacus]QDU70829.1 Phosphoribosylformylglycinamidine synthase [Mucisphaera calidilacus]